MTPNGGIHAHPETPMTLIALQLATLAASAGPVQFAVNHREEISQFREVRACGGDRTWTTWKDGATGARFSYPPSMHQSACPDWSGLRLHGATSLTNQTCTGADAATSSLSSTLYVYENELASVTLEDYVNNWWSGYPIDWITVDGYPAANVYVADGYPYGTDVQFSITYVDVVGDLWKLDVRLQDHGDRADLAAVFDAGIIECSFHVQ